MALSTPNVLIVESDSRQTELAMELIRDVVRAKVDSTNSGERAVELVSRTNYQLVIADCGIGDMDGLTVLERVKRGSPSTSVILTSAFATIEEAVKALRYGADEYFKKPYNPEHFKLAVRRCLDRRDLYTGDQIVTGLMLLLNCCQLISGCLEEEKIFDSVTSYLRRETGCSGLALYKASGNKTSYVKTASDADVDVVEVLVDRHNLLKSSDGEKHPMRIITKSNGAPEIAIFEFRCVGDAKYFAVCIAPNWTTPSDEVDSRFRLLQAQIQMTGRNIQNYRGVRHLLYLDEPTGLYNTRYLHLCLDQYFERWEKDKTKKFSVLFIDVDRFKGINDSHGHLVGTKLLFEMGEIIRSNLRKGDVAFRYGGDEFVVLLDDAATDLAESVGERIREGVEGNYFLAKESLNIRLTVSIGVASCPEHAISKRDIIEAADNAMYSVKRSTRNSVYIAEKKAA
ncbi:MAG: diguanylate cyclase [Bdellovibrionota bacterium]